MTKLTPVLFTVCLGKRDGTISVSICGGSVKRMSRWTVHGKSSIRWNRNSEVMDRPSTKKGLGSLRFGPKRGPVLACGVSFIRIGGEKFWQLTEGSKIVIEDQYLLRKKVWEKAGLTPDVVIEGINSYLRGNQNVLSEY